ncbi:MAG: type II toxin-antitoxin system RelE family toxin [Paraclostridium sp.]
MKTNWEFKYSKYFDDDFDSLDGSHKLIVEKAIALIKEKPIPAKMLRNTNKTQLHPLLEKKIKGPGIRIIYSVNPELGLVKFGIIDMRSDDKVFKRAAKLYDELLV